MLSANTWTMSARQIIAPNVVVRGITSSIPASNSAQPVNISYAGEAPIEVQSIPCRDRLATGVINVMRDGDGNCTGMTLVIPYSNICDANAKRTKTRNHLCKVSYFPRRRSSTDHTTVAITAAINNQNVWIQKKSVSWLLPV